MDNQNRDIVLFGEPAGVYAAALLVLDRGRHPLVLVRPWSAEEEADGRRVMPVPPSGSVLRGVLDRLGLRPGHAGRPPAPSPVPRIQVVMPGRRFDVTSAWPFFAAEMEREFPREAAEIASLCAVSSASASGGPSRSGGVMDRFRRFLPKGEERRRPLSSEGRKIVDALAGAIGGEEPLGRGKMSPTDVLAVRNALGSGKVHRMNELTGFLDAEYKRRRGSVITRGPWTFRVHGKRVEVRSEGGAVVTAPRALGVFAGSEEGDRSRWRGTVSVRSSDLPTGMGAGLWMPMDGAAVFLKQVDPAAEEREGPAVSASLHVDLYSQGEKTAADVSNLVGTAIRFLMPFVTLDEGAVRMERNRASESFRLPERTGSEIQIVRVPFHPFVETGRLFLDAAAAVEKIA